MDKLNRVFTGRDNEIQQMLDLLGQARNRVGSFVLISGEAGTGKSRLVKELIHLVRKQNVAIAEKDFERTEYYQPYRPFWKLLEQLKDSTKQRVIAKTLPKPQPSEYGEPSNLTSFYTVHSRNHLVQQRLVTHLLDLARHKVIVLLLENIHFASATTWRFIHYLSRSIIESKIMIVLTLRLDGRLNNPDKIPVYADILKRMNRDQLIRRIELKRFNTRQIRELLYHTFQQSDFSNSFVPILKELSGGLPATLLKLLKNLVRNGIVYPENGIWINRDNFGEKEITRLLPRTPYHAGMELFERGLPEKQKNLLRYAALFDQKIDYRILADLFRQSRVVILKDLANLREQKLLRGLDDIHFKFHHRSVQLGIRERLAKAHTQRMHLKIAATIEACDYLSASAKVPLLGYHYSQTNQYEKAFLYLKKSGDLALGNFALTEANHFYRKAFSILEQLEPFTQKSETLPILLRIAWLTKVLGDRKKGLELYNQALQLSRDLNATSFIGEILVHKGLTHVQLSDYQNAFKSFRKVLLEDAHQTDHKLKTLAHIGMGNIYNEQSEFEKALSHYQTALELAKAADDKMSQANILNNMGVVQNILGNRIGAIALYSQAIPVYKENGDNYGLARVYNNIGITYAEEGNWKEANEFYGKSLHVSDTMGLVPLKSTTFLNRAIALINLQHLEEAEEYTTKAGRLLKRLHDGPGMAEYYRVQGMLDRIKGDYNSAREHLFTALEKFNQLNNFLGIAETEYEIGLLFEALHDGARGNEWLQRARDNFKKIGLTEKALGVTGRLEKRVSQ